MIEITNRQKFPVQIVVRSRKSTNSFTTLNIPGIGAGKNVYLLEDERATEYITRVKDWGLISLRTIPDNQN
jgi:hypothetical protein